MLMKKREGELVPRGGARDPFALFRQMTADFDQLFGEPLLRWPAFRTRAMSEPATYLPEIDVFEKDNRLVTKVDLPGMNKEDVKVEINDGRLVISGERKTDAEEKKEGVYRCERSYGSFYRAIPLPDGARTEDVKATFTGGVLEVSVPLPARVAPKPQSIPIEEPAGAGKKSAA
jgi:HSP20 family protein